MSFLNDWSSNSHGCQAWVLVGRACELFQILHLCTEYSVKLASFAMARLGVHAIENFYGRVDGNSLMICFLCSIGFYLEYDPRIVGLGDSNS